MVYCPKTPSRISVVLKAWPVISVVLLVLIAGLIMGSLAAGRMDNTKSQDLSLYLRDFIQQVPGINFEPAKIARNSMVNNVIMTTAIYILGLTVIGIPLILAIIFMRGFTIGFAIGFLAKDLSFSGLLLTLAAILPHNILNYPALCIGASASIMFSVLLLKRNFNTSIKIWPNLVAYTLIMSGILVLTLASSVVEGYITPLLTKIAAGMINSRMGLN